MMLAAISVFLVFALLAIIALILAGVLEIRRPNIEQKAIVNPQTNTFDVICPHCEHRLGIAVKDAGMVMACPLCGKQFRAPKITPIMPVQR